MPFGAFINAVPMPVFLVIHGAALLIGLFFASKALGAGNKGIGTAFLLYALAELLYLTYHLDWTVILFAHTLAEVCDLLAVILVFAATAGRVKGAAS